MKRIWKGWYLITACIVAGVLLFIVTRPESSNADEQKQEPVAIAVKTQKATELFESTEMVVYPGVIKAETEAVIIAKANGTASNVGMTVGDRVTIGQELVKIDDVNSVQASVSSGLNASIVKQAQVAVEQSLASLQMARTNYATVLQTSNNDLRQAEIAAEQSSTAQQNLNTTTEEGLKAAESAYETAKLATEQARLALESRKKMIEQGTADIGTNADTTMTGAVDASASVISSINSLTGVEVSTGGVVAYRDKLGTLDSGASERAHQSYVGANDALKHYQSKTFTDRSARLAAVSDLVAKTKKLSDDAKYLLEKTIPSSVLSQTLLTTLQTQLIGFQTQMNGVKSQINQVEQALANTDLSNTATLDAMQKAYEIAQQQERTALKNVENLKAGNTTQTNQASYAVQSAQNQLAAAKERIRGQVSATKSQVDLAEMQYQNALIALQNVSDAHRSISPIAGVVVKKSVSQGDTVSQGQVLAIIGTPDRLKTSFYIDQDSLDKVYPGLEVSIRLQGGASATGTVVGVAPQADAATHRYEVEVKPAEGIAFPLGSIVDVSVPLRKVAAQGTILLPLSAVDVTSNGSFIMVARDGKAERVQIEISRVLGEVAEIKAPIVPETEVIVEGNRRVVSGSQITVNQ